MKEKKSKKGYTVLIMGLGIHGGGIGAANFFSSRGANVVITDLKNEYELEESIAKLKNKDRIRFVIGRHDFKDFEGADLVIKNPAVTLDSPFIQHALKKGVRVDTDIGVFYDQIKGITDNVIGVTGTKGKSTTATLIHRIIQKRASDALLGGNITISVFDLIDRIKEGVYIVLELSSFQLGGIFNKGYSPRIGVFTNFMEDHLNYYGSLGEYFRDKTVLYRYQKEGDLLVINRDDRVSNLIEKNRGVKSISFGISSSFSGEGVFIRDNKVFYKREEGEDLIFNTGIIRLPGKHNLYNVLAAVSLAYHEGYSTEEIIEAIIDFRGIEHRLEYVKTLESISFYNDSAATTPKSAIEGIKSFDGPLTLIAGGTDKGLALEEFIEIINRRVQHLVLLEGSGSKRLMEGTPKHKLKKEYQVFNNLRDAVKHACRISEPKSRVLFSPGFASFEMFKNEFHRGNEFKMLVFEIADSGDTHEKLEEPGREEGS